MTIITKPFMQITLNILLPDLELLFSIKVNIKRWIPSSWKENELSVG